MSDVCALEGCAEPIEPQPDGAPPRKYCCQPHRTAARARRAVARRKQEQVVAPGQLAPSPEPDPVIVDPEPDELPHRGHADGGDTDPEDLEHPETDLDAFGNDDQPAHDPYEVAPFARIGTAVRRVVDQEDEDDGSPAPEDAGGGHGRAGTEVGSQSGPGPISAEDPDGAGAGERPVPSGSGSAVSRRPVPLRQLRKRPAWATPRTAVAAGLAAAMVLGGGTALFDVSQQTAPEALTPPPLPPGGSEWLDKADVALASTDSQLQAIGAAQQRWQAGAPTRGATADRPDVRALEARKAYLESQRSILASQIAAWQNLQQNNTALSTANAQLAALAQAADQPGQPSDVRQQIAAQRATLQARSQMLADQAAKWQQDVTQASSAPMPDTSAPATTAVVSRVDDLGKGPKPSAPPAGDRGESGSILAGRSPNSGDKERDLPGTAAPPRPDGGSSQTTSETTSGHGGVLAAVGGATKPVTDTVRDTGLLGDTEPGRGQKSSRGQGKGDDAGLVEPVQRTTGQVGGALGGAVDGLGGHDRSASADPRSGGGTRHAGAGDAVGGAVGGLLGGGQEHSGPTDRHTAASTPTVSNPAGSLPGMRAVGDLVGRAMDARHAQQQDHGTDRSSAKDALGGEAHSALMNLGRTTYRVGLPASSSNEHTKRSATDGDRSGRKATTSSRTSSARNSTERQVRAAATAWATKLVGKYAGTSSGGTGSSSGKSSGTSIKELKARHSSSRSSGSTDSGTKDSGSKGLARLVAAYSGKRSGGSGSGSTS